MSALELSRQELSELINEAMGLARDYLSSVDERRAFPLTGGEETTNCSRAHGPSAALAGPS
jgi:hypothetical protein